MLSIGSWQDDDCVRFQGEPSSGCARLRSLRSHLEARKQPCLFILARCSRYTGRTITEVWDCCGTLMCLQTHSSSPCHLAGDVKSLWRGGNGNNEAKHLHMSICLCIVIELRPHLCSPCPWSQVLTITWLSCSPNTQFKEPIKPSGIRDLPM